jgi:hypothetical protein
VRGDLAEGFGHLLDGVGQVHGARGVRRWRGPGHGTIESPVHLHRGRVDLEVPHGVPRPARQVVLVHQTAVQVRGDHVGDHAVPSDVALTVLGNHAGGAAALDDDSRDL